MMWIENKFIKHLEDAGYPLRVLGLSNEKYRESLRKILTEIDWGKK